MISASKYVIIAILDFFKFFITAMCLILSTDVITMYEIINFNIDIFTGWYRYKYWSFSCTCFIPKRSIYIITVYEKTVHFSTTYKV